ncbi:MAG: hypothetical protein IPH62_15410 [Ignavibacteriae bacterium]|nr:hypothetical protein [Ignavibacteriota bacterium]
MIKNKEVFVKELLSNPELKDNIISYVFAFNPNIDISLKNNYFDNVVFHYEKYKNDRPKNPPSIKEIKDDVDKWTGLDLRIKKIRLKSIRGFPDSEIPFGIDLVNENDVVQNMVILGGNAIGKSSIYDSIEYIFCNDIGEAQLRNYDIKNQDRYKKYLEHYDNGSQNTYCTIQTVDKLFDISNSQNIPETVRKRINPNTHFISEYDIYKNGQLDYENSVSQSFHNLIAKSIGLEDLLEFSKNLKSFILYRRATESRGINKASENINIQQKLIDTTQKALTESKKKLFDLENEQKVKPEEEHFKKLVEIINRIKNNSFTLIFSHPQLLSTLHNFKNEYNNFISRQFNSINVNELHFLNMGLELITKFDNCPFCLDSKLQKNEIEENATERKNKIEGLNQVIKNLNSELNDLVDKLQNIYSQFLKLDNNIRKEISEISDCVEFNNLVQIEMNFSKYIANLLSADIFVEISKLDNNPQYLKNRTGYVYKLVNDSDKFISELAKIESELTQLTNNRNSEVNFVDSNLQNKTQIKSITEQIIETKKEIRDYESHINEANRVVKNEFSKKEELENTLRLFNEIKESTKQYEKIVSSKINDIVNSAFAPIKIIVEEVLEEYFNIDNRDINLIISKEPDLVDEETGEILSEVITAKIKLKKSKEAPQSISKVLNTFHFRLFSTMVGVAIAITSRINTRINMPLVMDDIFYASDFENRVAVEEFIRALFKVFYTFTPDLPLQLILFTHDQLIFESAMKAFNEIDKLKGDSFAFAKLFSHEESTVIGDYKDLIYKIPAYYAKQQYKNTIEMK